MDRQSHAESFLCRGRRRGNNRLLTVLGYTEKRRAFPILPGREAIRMAGDNLDEIILHEILTKIRGGLNSWMRANIDVNLRLRELCRLKEQMFINGRLVLTIVNDQSV